MKHGAVPRAGRRSGHPIESIRRQHRLIDVFFRERPELHDRFAQIARVESRHRRLVHENRIGTVLSERELELHQRVTVTVIDIRAIAERFMISRRTRARGEDGTEGTQFTFRHWCV